MSDELIVTKSTEGFMSYLPGQGTFGDTHADAAVKCLRENDLLHCDGHPDGPCGGCTWHAVGSSEPKAFEPLQAIFDMLATQEFGGAAPNVVYGSMPYHTTNTDIDGGSHKIDGYFVRVDAEVPVGKKPGTADIVCIGEYKLGRNPEDINRLQICSAANFIMNNDTRRTHVYGFTIEESRVSFWYFSRSHSAKSAVFDLVNNFRDIIKVFLALLYAKQDELGYDPNVWRFVDTTRNVIEKEDEDATRKKDVDNHHPLTFVYKVGSRYYKTLCAIADYSSLCVTGRATRVWLVTEITDIENLFPLNCEITMILKDYWLDVGTDSEGTTQRQIFADLAGVANIIAATEDTVDGSAADPVRGNLREGTCAMARLPPTVFDEDTRRDIVDCFASVDETDRERLKESLKNYQRHFLTLEAESEGVTSLPPATPSFRVVNFFEVQSMSRPVRASAAGADSTRSLAQVTGAQQEKASPLVIRRTFTSKRRCFIVFKENCNTLHNTKDLSQAISTISDCLRASLLLLLAGWVHRDISGGNLLQYQGRGIMSDLEYARRYTATHEASEDPKTGTPFFMSIEIQRNKPMAQAQSSKPSLPQSGLEASDEDESDEPDIDIIHNYTHDAESFWWLILWFLTARIPYEASNTFVSEVFQNAVKPSAERCSTFAERDCIRNLRIQNTIHPEVKHITIMLARAGQALVFNHQMRGQDKKKVKWETRSEYTDVFIFIRALVDQVTKTADNALGTSALRDLKTYRDEEPWVDDHLPRDEVAPRQSAQIQAIRTAIRQRKEASGLPRLIPPYRMRKRGRSASAADDPDYVPPGPSKAAMTPSRSAPAASTRDQLQNRGVVKRANYLDLATSTQPSMQAGTDALEQAADGPTDAGVPDMSALQPDPVPAEPARITRASARVQSSKRG